MGRPARLNLLFSLPWGWDRARVKIKKNKRRGAMVIIGNAFSINMISQTPAMVTIQEIGLDEVKKILNSSYISAVGHASTAELLTKLLGKEIKQNRVEIKLKQDDVLIVFQVLTRLPEGVVLDEQTLTTIPYKFFKIVVNY
jgi:hypothetical protein